MFIITALYVVCIYISAAPTDYTLHISCLDFRYECDNGLCIRYSSKCDGYNDCGDNADEIGCDGSGSSGTYTLYMYNVKCILIGEWISQCLPDIMWRKATTLICASFLLLSIDFELLSVKYSKIVAVIITYPYH